ncbi:non-ribosomal peptide synthetase, partial [Actinomadura sp. KC216]|uniref:condensation domain-containing protein n=1 Tax=Actinomadura sp. KC216 TaxID=2530370 RepID=UPI0010DD1EB0
MDNLAVEPQERTFRLTDLQRVYLIGRSKGLALGGVSSHHYLEFEQAGLDVPRLETALNKVIARHDMLRACVTSEGSHRVSAAVPPYRIATVDLSGLPTADRDAGIQRIRDELCEQMLPPDRWPPFDIRAALVDGGRVRLHVSMDLLLVDIRSLLIVLAEWRRFYDTPDWSPEPLELSFGDYLVLEEKDQRAEAQAAEYW